MCFAAVGLGVAWALCPSPLDGLCAALWWVAVVIVVRADIDRFIIPDGASAAIAALGLMHVLATGLSASEPPAVIGTTLAGAGLNGALGFALFLALAGVYRAARGREGLGFGDVKLAGASAIWLTPSDAAMAVEIAALGALALLLARRGSRPWRETPVPFGAFLAPAAWLVFVLQASSGLSLDGL